MTAAVAAIATSAIPVTTSVELELVFPERNVEASGNDRAIGESVAPESDGMDMEGWGGWGGWEG